MGLFFGTDGIRGEFQKDMTAELCYRCANALSKQKQGAKILIAKDTRASGDFLMMSFVLGAIAGGMKVSVLGFCPTAGVSYLTKKHGFDFGVMISASHNSAEFNGIKIMDKNGVKIDEKIEREIEKNLIYLKTKSLSKLGSVKFCDELLKEYEEFLISETKKELGEKRDFSGLKIVLDCSNGAAFQIAPKIFESFGAKLFVIGTKPDGLNINKNCGSLHISKLQTEVIRQCADMGFAFDGDSDRLIAVAHDGTVVDGDGLIYIFAKHYSEQKKFKKKIVVGTRYTNMGVQKALEELGIKMIRTDIGDRFVSEALEKNNLLIGGEQSGHVFLKDKLQTGDGILNALILAAICSSKNKRLKEFLKFDLFYQKNISTKVKDKQSVLNDDELQEFLKEMDNKMLGGRIMVRASGTESLVRIMTESKNEEVADFVANEIEKMIKNIDQKGGLCVE